MPDWPEGDAADAGAARERYETDLRASRQAMAELFRADVADAHTGLAVVVVATVVVGRFASLVPAAAVAGTFATLFLVALAVGLARGRGGHACRRAYTFTFGWGKWLVP